MLTCRFRDSRGNMHALYADVALACDDVTSTLARCCRDVERRGNHAGSRDDDDVGGMMSNKNFLRRRF
jgi:hypothetical protein